LYSRTLTVAADLETLTSFLYGFPHCDVVSVAKGLEFDRRGEVLDRIVVAF